MQFRILRNIKTGRRHIVSREKYTPQKSKKRVYANIVGWKELPGGGVRFTYDKEATFLTDVCEFLYDGEHIDLTRELVKELQEEYFASLKAEGKRVVYSTTHRARNQKYHIVEDK